MERSAGMYRGVALRVVGTAGPDATRYRSLADYSSCTSAT
jgi:hypothetical protein